MSGNGMNGDPGSVQGLAPERGLSCSVLTDGRTATLVWQVVPSESVPDGKLSVTIPASGLHSLRACVHRAMDMADREKGWRPRKYGIGNPENWRNTVALTLDEGPDQLVFLFADIDALQLGQGLLNNVFGRMDAAERAKLSTALITPRRGIFLIPGKG